MIDLAAAKAHLRVEGNDEDGPIAGYLAAAIGAVERATGKKLTVQDVTQTLNGFPDGERAIRLWWGPIDPEAAVTIAYDDTSGTAQTLGDFRLVEGSTPSLLPAYGSVWPYAYPAAGSARITYPAGYTDVPPELDQAVLMLVGHFYLNREAVNSAASAAAVELPLGVQALIAPYRLIGLA